MCGGWYCVQVHAGAGFMAAWREIYRTHDLSDAQALFDAMCARHDGRRYQIVTQPEAG